MKVFRWLLAPVLLFGLVSACESPVELPQPTSIQATPDSVEMLIGETAQVAAQILDQDSAVMEQISATWSSKAPGVVRVSPAGVLTAAAEGNAQIVATYGQLTDTVFATVGRAAALVSSLDILEDTLAIDVAAGAVPVTYEALTGLGTLLCFTPLSLRFDANVINAVQSGAGDCQINVTGITAGSSWLYATVNEVTDSVLVEVTQTSYDWFWNNDSNQVPHDSLFVAGSSVEYSFLVEDEDGNPAEGITFNFDPTKGTMSSETVVTGSDGIATTTWNLTTRTGNESLTVTGTGPAGQNVTNMAHNVTITPDDPASMVIFEDEASYDATATSNNPAAISSFDLRVGTTQQFYMQAYDQYGNLLADTEAVVASANPDALDITLGQDLAADWMTITSDQTGTYQLFVSQGSAVDTLLLTVSTGPEMVYVNSANDNVIMSQITGTGATTAYNGGGSNDTNYPTFTANRDTVAFLALENIDPDGAGVQPAANYWRINTVPADGSLPNTPYRAVIPDSLVATAAWGFPVFEAAGSSRGNAYFLSDKYGSEAWNLYKINQGDGTWEKITSNTSADTIFRGLSLSPDGSKVLVVTEQVGGTTASNVYEITLSDGSMTAITNNTDTNGAEYRHATYSPDGSVIYIDRDDGASEQLLKYDVSTGFFSIFDQDGSNVYWFMPSFDPNDDDTIAYIDLDGGNRDIFTRGVDEPESEAENQTGPYINGDNIKAFSWRKR